MALDRAVGPQLTPAVTPDAAVSLDVSSRNVIAVGARGRGETKVGELAHVAVIAGLLLLAFLLVAPMFSAALGAIDDHQVITLQHVVAAQGVPAAWSAVDVGEGRFRPLYWILWVGEVLVWGQNATGWYLDRLLLALATVAAGYALARLWLRPVPAAFVAALILAGPQAEAFARLGPQEAWAVPITLAGLVLIGRGRASGLVLTTAAAFIKEPFILAALVAAWWAWRAGMRRPAAVSIAAVGVAVAGVAIALLERGALPVADADQGRYLFPFVIAAALAGGWLIQRHRVLVPVALVWVALMTVGQLGAATTRAADTRHFQAVLAELRAAGRPVVINLTDRRAIEYAQALEVNLAGEVLVAEVTDPRTAPVNCVEVAVAGAPAGWCPLSVALP